MLVEIKWMAYMLDGENNKIYSRKGINIIATEFYKKLHGQSGLEENKGKRRRRKKQLKNYNPKNQREWKV